VEDAASETVVAVVVVPDEELLEPPQASMEVTAINTRISIRQYANSNAP